MRGTRRPFDIDAWLRRHPVGQPFPRVRHEPTRPMTGRERIQALRDERREAERHNTARDVEQQRASRRYAAERSRAWEWERDRLWDEERGTFR
jgi:hypothetical protein